ncbi:MAG: TetR/AcrR family transcriptional regulator [Gammaproteobacteria bacterium]|nr:MAG: TetR/AcrR family transcriptional regulator [Gammaproteobacteria bacterium]
MDTPSKILAAAEPLIARQGPEAISLREVAKQAGQKNTAALHYHFGGKEPFINQLVSWRLRPINRLRDRQYGNRIETGASLAELVDRLVDPFLMELKTSLAQSPECYWARCLARLDVAGAITTPHQPDNSRWQNSLLATLQAIAAQLSTPHPGFVHALAFHCLLQGLAEIERGICDDAWPLESLHTHGTALKSSLLGMLAAQQP